MFIYQYKHKVKSFTLSITRIKLFIKWKQLKKSIVSYCYSQLKIKKPDIKLIRFHYKEERKKRENILKYKQTNKKNNTQL